MKAETVKREALFEELKAALLEELEEKREAGDEEIREMIRSLILAVSRRQYLPVDERIRLTGELFSSVRRLDILQELIDDKSVTEIMVNGPDTIFLERNGRMERWEKTFSSKEKLAASGQTSR